MNTQLLSRDYEWAKTERETLPSAPAIYKLVWPNGDTYIGETVNMKRRHYGHCHPGATQQTNIRLAALNTDHGMPEVYLLNANPAHLEDKFARKCIEHGLVYREQPSLNR